MQRYLPLLGLLTLAGLLGSLVFLFVLAEPDPLAEAIDAPSMDDEGEAIRLAGRPTKTPPREIRALEEDSDRALRLALHRAGALLREGRHEEARALLEAWREKRPEAFDSGTGAELLAKAAEQYEAERAQRAAASLEARRTRAAENEGGRDAVAVARTPGDRGILQRHVERFAPTPERGFDAPDRAAPEASDAPGAWVDRQYDALVSRQREWPEEVAALAIADPEAAETRRIEQLQRLAERGVPGLLEPVQGALLWLALHQGDDGRFSDQAMRERCEALQHDRVGDGRDVRRVRPCFQRYRARRGDYYAVSATALALLAFLDFRDQDAKGVFEETIARAVHWLVTQQQTDGTFGTTKGGRREYYTTAIALMALAQAAGSSGDAKVAEVVARGLSGLYAKRGPHGGYRYGPGQAGDLSVSGWVAQAIEAARAARIEIPKGMEKDLRGFLDKVWMLEWRFHYMAGTNERTTLYPVGMLTGLIVWEQEPQAWLLETWGKYLKGPEASPGVPVRRRPDVYSVYYGLRMSLRLEGQLADPWKTWVLELAKEQETEDHGAGVFQLKRSSWMRTAGVMVTTGFAALTLEHALYER